MAYRQKRQEGTLDHPAWEAACAAYAELATLDRQKVAAGIHYGTMIDPEWFWRGVASEWEWPRR